MVRRQREDYPGHVPQPPQRFTLEIQLAKDMDSPHHVLKAIDESIKQYGFDKLGTRTPFNEQPGFAAGAIISATGRRAGGWSVE